MVTLTKLLDIRMVASKYSESPSNALIRESDGCSSPSILLRSDGDKEKNAISDAETKPEAYNKTAARIIATTAPAVGGVTVTPSHRFCQKDKYESGSKEIKFS